MFESLQEYGVAPQWILPIVVLTGLALFLIILWIILPFAVFGTKSLLRRLLHEVQEMNHRLQKLEEDQAALRHSVPGRSINPSPAREPTQPVPPKDPPGSSATEARGRSNPL